MPTTPTLLLKRIIAGEYINGASISELAERHGMSYQGMTGLLRSKTVMGILEEERNRVLQAAERARLKYLLAMEQLADRMMAMALDPLHPKAFDANKWIQERFVAAKNSSEMNVNFHINPEAAKDIGEALAGVRRVWETAQPTPQARLLKGEDVFPPVELEAEVEGDPDAHTQ